MIEPKVLLILCLAYIALQDFKERKVFWFLFPLAMACFGLMHFTKTANIGVFLYQVGINWLSVSLVILILFLYTRWIAKKAFLNHSLGLGDILFFLALGLGFPPLTFTILFAGAILFSVLIFISLKSRLKWQTVPLAGLMSTYIIFIISYSLVFNSPDLYVI